MKKIKILNSVRAAFFAGIFLYASALSAQPADKEERYPTVGEAAPAVPQKAALTPAGKPYNIGISASLLFGYDSNVRLLQYDRAGSMFFQEAAGVDGKYPLNEFVTVRGSYNFTAINYTRFSDPNLVDNLFDVGIDLKLAEGFVWSLDYKPDIVGIPHDRFAQYMEHQFSTSVRQDLTKNIYQKISYSLITRHYPKWITRNGYGNAILAHRNDLRNTVSHQLGIFITKNLFLKEDNIFYYNDSSDVYQRYYDYKSYTTKTSLIHFTTKKLYESANFSYQYKPYDKRAVTDRQENVREHQFAFGGAVFYDFTDNLTASVNFDWRKNRSNEGFQNYTDYIISSGIYCRF